MSTVNGSREIKSKAGRGIAGSASIVMASVMVSRILGFLREWTLAHQVGSNRATDAYYAAFTLPDFLNYLVAGASLSVLFIPVFTKYVTEGKEDEAWYVFSTVVTFMSLLMTAIVILGEIFAPQIVNAISPGFAASEKVQVVYLTRIMLPAQICFVLGSVFSAVQYAKNQFLIPSLATVVYNLFIILGGWVLSPKIGITGFAVGLLTGAIVGNLLLQLFGTTRTGAHYRPNLNLRHPGFLLFLKLAVPIMLALSLTFTDDWIMRWYGSYLQPASITWLTYAKTLMRVPLTAVGQAVGVASFPVLTQMYAEGRFDELNRILNSTVKGLLFIILPVSALTVAQNSTVVRFVFSNTRLHGSDFRSTGLALAVFSAGMFAWAAQYLLSRGFYATQNTWTPALVGTLVTVANLPLYSYLVKRHAYLGLASASSIGIVVYMLVLFVLLNRHTRNHQALEVVGFFAKVAAASTLAGWACYRLTFWFQARVVWQTRRGSLLLLMVCSSVGLAVFFAAARLLGISRISSYLLKGPLQRFRRSPAASAA